MKADITCCFSLSCLDKSRTDSSRSCFSSKFSCSRSLISCLAWKDARYYKRRKVSEKCLQDARSHTTYLLVFGPDTSQLICFLLYLLSQT
mmetsp:Transcript_21363/g.48209  ORF Transcript_21363/g.48209 Transcript_21363/m.48209 type:complete len:90 (-) Transcript_21363:2196-2465(-)